MKVLQVIEGQQIGGAEIQVEAVLDALVARGHEVAVLAAKGGEFARHAATKYPEVHGWTLRREGAPHLPFRFRRLVRRSGIDLVNVHNPRPLLMAVMARRLGARFALVATRRVSFPVSTASWWLKWRSRHIDAFVTIAEQFAEYWLDRGIPREKLHLIHSGSDLGRFRPGAGDGARVRRELGLPDDARVVLKVAHFYPWKGHATFLGAAERLVPERPDVRFVAVGEGPPGPEAELRARVAAAGLGHGFVFAGRRADMPDVYAAADVVFQGSLSGDAPAGSLREALAMAIPCVASDQRPNAELVRHGETGLLFRTGDPDDAAAMVARTLDDPDGAAALARAGCDRVHAHFSLDAMCDRTIALLERLVAQRRR